MKLSEENKVIELKYSGKLFGKMTEDERRLSSYTILLKIHAITGWTVPVSGLMDILVDQFSLKLSESYANANEQEVEYAFRNKGIETKDWGKALNLSLIDEVMIPYLESRYEISRMEESLNKTKMIEDKIELTDEERQEWVNDWINKEVIDVELIPLLFYEYLDRVGELKVTKENKWEYVAKSTAKIKSKLITEMDICRTNNAYLAFQKFEQMEKDGFEGEFKGRILSMSKRLILHDYFINKKLIAVV